MTRKEFIKLSSILGISIPMTTIMSSCSKDDDGMPTAPYVKHIFQNWNEEPFANGAFLNYNENAQRINTLSESVNNKLFFAGDAYTNGTGFSSVHSAVRSAKKAVEELVG